MHKTWRFVVCAGLWLLPASRVAADALDEVRQRGALRWGGDQEGGGPYIYPSPQDPTVVQGFEVDVMKLLADRLKVRSQFVQCEWTQLPNELRTGSIEVIVNGYELTAAHRRTKIATFPYYVYELQLLARKNDESIQSWDDLKTAGRKMVVGLLAGSVAEPYVRQRLGDAVEVRRYPGSTDALRDVSNGNIDATVQDTPPAIFYRNRFPDLRFIGDPVGQGYYVMYLQPGEERLRDALDAGILDLLRTGQLKTLYERYGLWNTAQEKLGSPKLGQDTAAPASAAEAEERSTEVRGGEVLRRNLPILLRAAGVTILLACLAMPLAIGIGLSVALGRLYGPAPLRWLLTVYVEVLRGTPLLMQLLTIYYVIPPALGLHLDPMLAAVIGLALNYSAYESEIYRAGLLAIPVGQMEAALALGMSRAVALRRVVVPQAVRLVVPPVTNDFIALFKDTSVCSVITVVELSKEYNILVNSTNAYLELAAVTALLYLLMSYPLALLSRRLERRSARVMV